jgi:hypothetical protein
MMWRRRGGSAGRVHMKLPEFARGAAGWLGLMRAT